MRGEKKIKVLPMDVDSKETDQDFTFWDKSSTWDIHLTSEEESLKSFDEMEAKREKLSKLARMITGNQLERRLGRQGAVEAILNEVHNGNAPIVGIRGGQVQLEMKFLNSL